MFTRDIKKWIFSLKDEDLILAKQAYENNFVDMKEATFYQLLARLNEEKYIGKIAKGLYYKPKKNDFDALPSSEKLLSFFTNKEKNGMIVGAKMFAKYGIVPSNDDTYEIFTNIIEIKTRRFIANLIVENVDVDFRNQKIRRAIEVLELIENIDDFENVNYTAIEAMLKDYALNYSEDDLFKVLLARTYKKRNIAALKIILEHYNVENSLSRQLNTASKYAFPKHIQVALGI